MERDYTQSTTNAFPVHVLPERLQRIIRELHDSNGFPVDYTAASMMAALSVAVGNSHRVEVKRNWHESAILYIAIVGRPGACKSHPLAFAMRPLVNADWKNNLDYQKKYAEYQQAIAMSRKERVHAGFEQFPKEPKRLRYLVSDVTQEGLSAIHSHNPRGLCLWVDELSAWFKNFTRYNNGSEEQFWLSAFNGSTTMSDRKNSQNSIFIRRPFISVVGTIQKRLLTELANGERTANGFIDRLLFVMPNNQDKQPWSDKEPTFDIEAAWAQIIEKLVAIPYETDTDGNVIANILPFVPDAKARLYEWQRRNTEECNREECDALKGVYNKFDFHAIRFCLILQMARWACGEADRKEIDLVSVENAISLVDYFKATATRVQSIIRDLSLSERQRAVIMALPDEFTTEQGVEIASANSMPERTFKDFIRRFTGIHFQKVRHGVYSKL